MVKFREVPPVIEGPANGPLGVVRVSTNRHGVTGTKYRAAPVIGEMPPPFTVNATAFDTPPPGFVTVIAFQPAEATSAAVIDAVNCVALTNVVVRALPLKLTVAPLTKSAPFTVSVNANPPAVPVLGDSEVIANTAVSTVIATEAGLTVPGNAVVVSVMIAPSESNETLAAA
jgi:hypothetical protein